MAYDTLNLKNSAAQLAAKTATQPSINRTITPKIFTAAQATTAVQNYAKSVDTTSLNSILANYQYVFDSISAAAAKGETSISITTTNFDYTYIKPLFVSYGYIVSELPSSESNPSDTTLQYDITISWPSSIPTPITGLSPSSFIAIQNSPYSVTFVPQGGQGPYNFTVTGTLPDNWTVGNIKNVSTLTIQGTSSNLGGGSITVTVVDSISQSFTSVVNWTVTQPAQIQSDWTAISGLGFIRNKPTQVFVGTTAVPFPGTSVARALTGITSIDGNAATVTDGVYTTGEYANPSWITELAGAKITGSVAQAVKLTTARNINSVAFDGTGNITIPSLVNNSSSVAIDSSGILTFNGGQGAQIDGAFGPNNNGIQIRGSTLNPNGPGDVHLVASFNGQYNEITLNGGALGLRSATSDGVGGGMNPSTGITMTPTLITVNGTITMGGLVQFIGGTSGLSKASVGLGNVTNESKATMFTDSTFTGTTAITTANITTAGITQGTLTTVNNTDTSLVNKQYVDSRAFFALAVGIY